MKFSNKNSLIFLSNYLPRQTFALNGIKITRKYSPKALEHFFSHISCKEKKISFQIVAKPLLEPVDLSRNLKSPLLLRSLTYRRQSSTWCSFVQRVYFLNFMPTESSATTIGFVLGTNFFKWSNPFKESSQTKWETKLTRQARNIFGFGSI